MALNVSPDSRGFLRRAARTVWTAANSSLARASSVYIVASIVNAFISLLLVPVLTRLLGPEEYGIAGVFMALVSVAAVFVGLSSHGFLSVRFFNPGPEPFGSYVGASVFILAICTAICGAALPVFSARIELLTGIPVRWQWAVIVAAAGQSATVATLTVLQVHARAVTYGVVQITAALLSAAATLLLILWAGLGWEARALGHAGTAAAVGAAGLLLLHHKKRLALRFRMRQVGETLRFSLPLIPHLIAAVLMTTIDRIVITAKVDHTEAGLYFVAFQVASMLTLIAGAVNQAWVPWLYERLVRKDFEIDRRIVRITYLLWSVFAAAAALLALSSVWLTHIFAGERFAGAAQYIYYLAPAAAFSGMYHFVANYIFFAQRTELMSFITVSISVVQVALTLIFVSRYGAIGAAVAAAISSALYLGLTWYVAQTCVPMPWFGKPAVRRTR